MSGNRLSRRHRVHLGIRKRIVGTADKPRLSIYKSNKYIYSQIIDDTKGFTIVAVNSASFGKSGINVEVSKKLGEVLAEKALSKGIKTIVFDRSGYKYHGNIKALADGARSNGLKF
jgi:large subunit ribosomal protein L18